MQHTTMSSGLGDMRSIPLAGLVSRCSMRTQKGVDCSAVPVVGLSIHQVKRKTLPLLLGSTPQLPSNLGKSHVGESAPVASENI